MELREEAVVNYLKTHPKFLESYVTGTNVSKITFQKWAAKRSLRKYSSKPSINNSKWLAEDLTGQRSFLAAHGTNSDEVLYELAEACAQLVGADSFDLLVVKDSQNFQLVQENNEVQCKKTTKAKKAAVFSQGLIDCAGNQLGTLSFNQSVNDHDAAAVRILCVWGCALVHFAQEMADRSGNIAGLDFLPQKLQGKLSSFLLDVTRSIFQDIVSMDTVILKIMNFAQKLTNADRASLFLVDQKTNELYARIFDVGTDTDENIKINEDGNKEIRFPAGKGISGYVATTGQKLNIPDAYEDERFNKEIDQKTGYKTRNLLCMPIFIRGVVIGVVQMVNKLQGQFTDLDENAFETFAVYCGLALHYAKLYDRIRRSEQKYRVALEVLAYHSVCNKDEVNKLKSIKLKDHIEELDSFGFSGLKLSEVEKPLYAVYMFRTLFKDLFRYDEDDLIRFVLTVRKNYRRVAYHNWMHGWTVAQAMFSLLRSTSHFTSLEALAMYVGCLCHDLDHRGKNNAYMKTMSTPLAAIYSTSVMEHHHFNQTVTILQQEGHNILKSLSSEDYKQVLGCIKQCILATDLALFFPNRAKLSSIVAESAFKWNDESHRLLTRAVAMTGCDLVAAAKPWLIQAETVKVIYGEFYDQGDAERLNGREPIAMMDRRKAHELPQMQVGFMEGICLPCYEILSKVVPETAILYERTKENAKRWKDMAAEQKKKNESDEDK